MEIITVCTGQKWPVEIVPVEEKDFKVLTKRRYSFDWKKSRKEHKEAVFYKLRRRDSYDILSVMCLVDESSEKRIQIVLIANSVENKGAKKYYDGIAGCMIAFACKQAYEKYLGSACVSLEPKTTLKAHYMSEYGMEDGIRQVYLEGIPLIDMIKKYNP